MRVVMIENSVPQIAFSGKIILGEINGYSREKDSDDLEKCIKFKKSF